MKIILAAALLAATLSGCKTPNSDSRVKDAELQGTPATSAVEEPTCALDEKTWAGKMGMKLKDVAGAAEIECVVVGQGLHHIGLKVGDAIKALNGGERVASAADFEAAATKVAGAVKQRWRHFKFKVARRDGEKDVEPSPEYPGCGLFAYDDCGPLGQ